MKEGKEGREENSDIMTVWRFVTVLIAPVNLKWVSPAHAMPQSWVAETLGRPNGLR